MRNSRYNSSSGHRYDDSRRAPPPDPQIVVPVEDFDTAVHQFALQTLVAMRADTDHAVTSEALWGQVSRHFPAQANARMLTHIPEVRDLIDKERRLTSFVQCYICVRTIATGFELEKAVCAFFEVQRFEQLHLGPFIDQPIIRYYFCHTNQVKIIPVITSLDVVTALKGFIDYRGSRHGDVNAEDFLKYLAKRFHLVGHADCMVRIQNLGAYVTQLNKVQRGDKDIAKLASEAVTQHAIEQLMRPEVLTEKPGPEEDVIGFFATWRSTMCNSSLNDAVNAMEIAWNHQPSSLGKYRWGEAEEVLKLTGLKMAKPGLEAVTAPPAKPDKQKTKDDLTSTVRTDGFVGLDSSGMQLDKVHVDNIKLMGIPCHPDIANAVHNVVSQPALVAPNEIALHSDNNVLIEVKDGRTQPLILFQGVNKHIKGGAYYEVTLGSRSSNLWIGWAIETFWMDRASDPRKRRGCCMIHLSGRIMARDPSTDSELQYNCRKASLTDVIGVRLSVPQRRIEFFVNGIPALPTNKSIELPTNSILFSEGVYPTIVCSGQCRFAVNMGQREFAYQQCAQFTPEEMADGASPTPLSQDMTVLVSGNECVDPLSMTPMIPAPVTSVIELEDEDDVAKPSPAPPQGAPPPPTPTSLVLKPPQLPEVAAAQSSTTTHRTKQSGMVVAEEKNGSLFLKLGKRSPAVGSAPVTLFKFAALAVRSMAALGASSLLTDLEAAQKAKIIAACNYIPIPQVDLQEHVVNALQFAGQSVQKEDHPALTLLTALHQAESRLNMRYQLPFCAMAGIPFVEFVKSHIQPNTLIDLVGGAAMALAPPSATTGTASGVLFSNMKLEIGVHEVSGKLAEFFMSSLYNPSESVFQSLKKAQQYIEQQFNLASFNQTGWPSVLHFVSDHPNSIDSTHMKGSGMIDEVSLLSFVVSASASLRIDLDADPFPSSSEAMLAQALKVQFGVKTVEDLGLSSGMKTILERMKQSDRKGEEKVDNLSYAAVATNRYDPDAMDIDSVGCLGSLSRVSVVQAVLKTPYLVDISSYTCWDSVFSSEYGSLREFALRVARENSHEVWLLEGTGWSSSQMASYSNSLMWVDPTADVQSVEAAVSQGDPYSAAVAVVSLAVVSGGLAGMPLVAVRGAIARGLATAFIPASPTPQSLKDAGRFILDVISCLPPFLKTASLATEVLCSAFTEVTKNSNDSFRWLMAACETHGEKCTVRELGLKTYSQYIMDEFTNSVVKANARPAAIPRSARVECSQAVGQAVVPLLPPKPHEVAKPRPQEEKPALPTPINSGNLDVIESIRVQEFGIGVNVSEEGRNIIDRQNSRLGRALERLSIDLYSKDTHFMLELLQNADDNSYPEGVLPKLCFVLGDHSLTVVNNEAGFQEKDIRAICDVGRSTKGKGNSGYIGQKGIGFKSVFRISHTPRIHSNGYHFGFNSQEGHMGYILPERVAPIAEEAYLFDHDWQGPPRTVIELPFRDEVIMQRGQFEEHIKAIQPSLLLFLNRLRAISIMDSTLREGRCMKRQDMGNGLVRVMCDGETFDWILVSEDLTPPPTLR